MKRAFLFFAALICIAFSAADAFAATCSWTGAVNTDWATAGNWSACQPGGAGNLQPAANDTVTIGAATNQPTLSTAAIGAGNISTITINSGGTLTVTTNGSLPTNGLLTINSGGTLLVSGGTVTITNQSIDQKGQLTLSSGTLNVGTN